MIDEMKIVRSTKCDVCGCIVPKDSIIVIERSSRFVRHFCNTHGMKAIDKERHRLFDIEVSVFGEEGA